MSWKKTNSEIKNALLYRKLYSLFDELKELLNLELKMIEPYIVLSMGRIAENALDIINYHDKDKIIQVPHPRAINSTWIEYITKYDDETKIQYIKDQLK